MAVKSQQKPNVAIRLSDDLQRFLVAAAARSYRSLSAEIRMRLEQSRALDQRAEESSARPSLKAGVK